MKSISLSLMIILLAGIVNAQTIPLNAGLKDFFPIYKKNSSTKIACITGDCQNGEGILLIMYPLDVRSNDNKKNAMGDVFMRFYVGKFLNNAKTFEGKTYFHYEKVENKYSKEKGRYLRNKDLNLMKYLSTGNIENGLPHFEGTFSIGEQNINTIPKFLPEGECTIRFIKHSLVNEPYTMIEGIFSNGYPSYSKVINYKNRDEIDYIVFEGRSLSLEMYREGKYYNQYHKGDKKFDENTYYLGELLANMRHGRGYEMVSGELVNNGFWFLDEPVDLSLFDEKDFISYENLEQKSLENISVLKHIGEYSGTVKNEKPHGYGSFTSDLFTYHGYFKDGQPEGLGTYTNYTYPNDNSNTRYIVFTFVGVFQGGKPLKGKSAYINVRRSDDYYRISFNPPYRAIDKKFGMFGSIQEGAINDNNWLEGEGISTGVSFDNGSKIRVTSTRRGTFKNGRLHGYGYSDEIGIRKTGLFQNGQFVNGEEEEHFSRLKQGDIIEVYGQTVYVTQSKDEGFGKWFVELSNKVVHRQDFKFKRSDKKYAQLIEYHTCTSCNGGGTHSRNVKITTMPTYSIERYQLVTTTVIKTKYHHGKTESQHITTKCGQCNGTGKIAKIKEQIK